MTTKALYILSGTYTIDVHDANLKKLYSLSIEQQSSKQVFDKERGKLHIITSSYYYRYDLTDTGGTREVRMNLSLLGGHADLTFAESTGAAYIVQYNSGYTSTPELYMIALDNVTTTPDASYVLPSLHLSGCIGTTFNVNHYKNQVVYDKLKNKIVVVRPINCQNASNTYETKPMHSFDLNLTTTANLDYASFGLCGNSGDVYNRKYMLTVNNGTAYQHYNNIIFNDRTGEFYKISNRITDLNKLTLEVFDADFTHIGNRSLSNLVGNALPVEELIYIWNYKVDSFLLYYSTGSLYELNNNMTECNYLTNIGSYDKVIDFNRFTNNIYTKAATSTKTAQVRNLSGEVLYENDFPFTESHTYGLVCEAPNAILSNDIGSARITYPAANQAVSDVSPHIIIQAGEAIDPVTQQFRVVADTVENTIVAGLPTDTYARAYDSWALGTNYNAGITWEYSTDHDPLLGDSTNGTWSPLGTGDGLKAGGVEPTNGVLATAARQVYVRMTVIDDLTGADTNTRWYFKVFSYSRNA